MSDQQDLQKKTAKGISWSALEKLTNRLLVFGVQIWLANLVDPAEFGLLNLILVFMMFSLNLLDGGFSQAIIQKKSIDKDDISTVFVFNIAIAIGLYAIIFAVAPLVSQFYGEPRLVLLLRVLGLNLIINSIGRIQHCLLIRNLRFKKLFILMTPATISGGLVGVIMASLGFEVWALIASQLATTTIWVALFWIFTDREMYPSVSFKFSSFRELAGVGLGILGSTLVNQSVYRFYELVIGKVFLFNELAFYSRARSFHEVPARSMNQVLNRVLFPVFSSIQEENERLLRALRIGIPCIAFVMAPAMALLMCAADNIIILLLKERYLPSADYMRWLPVLGFFYPIAAIQLSVIKAKGRTGIFFILEIVKATVALTCLFVALRHGLLAIVIGQVIASLINNLLVNMTASQLIFGYRIQQQLGDILPYVCVAAWSALVCLVSTHFLGLDSNFLMLVVKTTLFSAVYLLTSYLLGLQAIGTLIDKLQTILKSRQTASVQA